MDYYNEKQEIVNFAKVMFTRKLTNTTGANISLKVCDDIFLFTPSMMSMNKLFEISPDEILTTNSNGDILSGKGSLTKEFSLHMAIYNSRKNCNSVVHAHPRDCIVFAALNSEIPNVTEATQKLGTIETLEFAPAGSTKLVDNLTRYISENPTKFPLVVLLSKHGIIAADISLARAYDLIERVEYDAHIVLNTPLVKFSVLKNHS